MAVFIFCCRRRIRSHDTWLSLVRTRRYSLDGCGERFVGVVSNMVDSTCWELAYPLEAQKTEDAFRLEKNLADTLQVDHEGALRNAEQEAERARNAKTRFLETASNDMRHHLQTLSLLNGALRKTITQPKAQDWYDDDVMQDWAEIRKWRRSTRDELISRRLVVPQSDTTSAV